MSGYKDRNSVELSAGLLSSKVINLMLSYDLRPDPSICLPLIARCQDKREEILLIIFIIKCV